MVIAIRTGNNTMPLHYQWFYRSKSVGRNFSVDIAPGDLYVMSEKAVGTDWKKKSILTIRHASGAAKYVKIWENKLSKQINMMYLDYLKHLYFLCLNDKDMDF